MDIRYPYRYLFDNKRRTRIPASLDAYRHPFTALQHADGDLLHRIDDRGVITVVDASDLLRRCKRLFALDAMYLHDAPKAVQEFWQTQEGLRASEARWAAVANDPRAPAWSAAAFAAHAAAGWAEIAVDALGIGADPVWAEKARAAVQRQCETLLREVSQAFAI
ncbi:hypothetical protein [Paraburkholderia sp. J10-1]|uniref:hypothetical protein n=1 Tax=Paraburkholderia sp. J10-1 TaxID=2805430 RepID=UPI002AB705EA|nr:hypothetical protein [Paraburkholderia sp. J10-1]